MIVDCFTFYNEFDILELRLLTLGDVVDRFVLCEAPFTFRGEPKPLYFQENAERFARWRDRITVVTYPGPPDPDPWLNEHGQRDYLITGLTDCAPGDLILIGDVDEIPNPEKIGLLPQPGGMLVYRLMMLRGHANRADGGGVEIFPATRAMFYRDIPDLLGGQFSRIRVEPHPLLEPVAGGWHFTSLGGVEVMRKKMQSYSHAEFDTPYYTDLHVLASLYESAGGSTNAGEIPLDRLPAVLREPYWERYLWKPRPAISREDAARREHAHGVFGYLPADAAPVAVIARDPAGWNEAAAERFPERFGGVFTGIAPLAAACPRGAWVVVDRLECFPAGLLAELAHLGMHAIAFVTNARSILTLGGVLAGEPFPPGRALGRAEAEREVAASGLHMAGVAVVANRHIPWSQFAAGGPMLYHGTLKEFKFSELTAQGVHDFQSDAFIYTLHPPAAP